MIIQLKPSEIYFSQDSISRYFTTTGTLIGETLDALYEERLSVSDIKRISVVLVNGQWFTWDNRRLWVFRQLEKLDKCPYIYANVRKTIDESRLTTKCDGKEVTVRGCPGGYCSKMSVIYERRSPTESQYEEESTSCGESISFSRVHNSSNRPLSSSRRCSVISEESQDPIPTVVDNLWSAFKLGLGLTVLYLMWKY